MRWPVCGKSDVIIPVGIQISPGPHTYLDERANASGSSPAILASPASISRIFEFNINLYRIRFTILTFLRRATPDTHTPLQRSSARGFQDLARQSKFREIQAHQEQHCPRMERSQAKTAAEYRC